MTQNYIGVDLSKDWLDIYDPRSGHRRIANSDVAIGAFLAGFSPQALIVFEATSLCDGRILRMASAAGQTFHRLAIFTHFRTQNRCPLLLEML